MMHVLIDARLGYYRQAGITQYTRRLVRALADVSGGPALTVMLDRRDADVAWVPARVGLLRALTPAHHPAEPFTLPLELALQRLRHPFDILHSPDFITCRGRHSKVITIHDLYFMHDGGVMSGAGAAYYRRTAWSAIAADRIISVSHFTRDDILRMLPGVTAEKVAVVHEAADTLAASPADAGGAQGEPYVLFIGTFEPRKNLATLLRAMQMAPDVRVLITGARGWVEGDLAAQAAELGVAERVRFVMRQVDDAERDRLIRGARALVMPSLYEGFGLPPLEAMARGVPVVCSNAGSLPEIVGDAALLHEPRDADGLAAHLRTVWANPEVRADLAVKGLRQADRFSWQRAARETIDVYCQAMQAAAQRGA